jgi:hypothetical protein
MENFCKFGVNKKRRLKMSQNVVMFIGEMGWKKGFPRNEEEKEALLQLKSAFLKRWYIDQRSGNAIYESLEEAKKNKQPGEEVRVMAPPENIRKLMNHEDTVFYNADELPPRYPDGIPDDEIFIGPQGIDDEEIDKLPIAEEDMMTDLTEEDAMPLGDGEDAPEK